MYTVISHKNKKKNKNLCIFSRNMLYNVFIYKYIYEQISIQMSMHMRKVQYHKKILNFCHDT